MNSTLMLDSYLYPVSGGDCGATFHYGSYRIENTIIAGAYKAICDYSDNLNDI